LGTASPSISTPAMERAAEAISVHIAGVEADGEAVPEEREPPRLVNRDSRCLIVSRQRRFWHLPRSLRAGIKPAFVHPTASKLVEDRDGGPRSSRRATPMRWRLPPEIWVPPSPKDVFKPSGSERTQSSNRALRAAISISAVPPPASQAGCFSDVSRHLS